MYISVHIPKTAGTTIGYILDFGTRRRIFFDYSELEPYPEQLTEDINFLKKNKTFLQRKFDVIHGHFHVSKYLDVFPEAKYLVCLREPVSRTLSQYYHIIEEGEGSHWSYNQLMSGEMDLIDFAGLPFVKRAQSAHIEGKKIQDFSHVFLSEKLPDSIHKFQLNHNFQRNDPFMGLEGEASIPNTNPRSARKNAKKEFSKAYLKKVKEVIYEDVELYNEALSLYKKQ